MFRVFFKPTPCWRASLRRALADKEIRKVQNLGIKKAQIYTLINAVTGDVVCVSFGLEQLIKHLKLTL